MDPLIANKTEAPGFKLPALDGSLHTLGALRGRIVILNFWSAECPWSQRVDEALMADVQGWGERVALVTLAANASEPREMVEASAHARGLPLVLLDAEQAVVEAYGAQTTPHLFVIDAQGRLRYQGAYDDVTFRRRPPERFYLREAVAALLAGGPPPIDSTPPYGCAIIHLRDITGTE